jgi:hypothetical protein
LRLRNGRWALYDLLRHVRVSCRYEAHQSRDDLPPLGVLFGWLLLGERAAWPDLLGILPVAIGIYLVTRPAGRPKELSA